MHGYNPSQEDFKSEVSLGCTETVLTSHHHPHTNKINKIKGVFLGAAITEAAHSIPKSSTGNCLSGAFRTCQLCDFKTGAVSSSACSLAQPGPGGTLSQENLGQHP